MNPPTLHILVTGGNGQLGSELKVLSDHTGWKFTFTDLPEVDLTDKDSVYQYFDKLDPDICINCAAFTAVDKAETERDLARNVNVVAVKNLAQCCFRRNTTLFHISTDFVFNGEGNTPLRETDSTAPLNYYGITKLEGENAALDSHPGTVILRTSWLYSRYGNNFVKTMLRLSGERTSLNIVHDQFGSPTFAADLATALLEIIGQLQSGLKTVSGISGIYHYSNEGVVSWYDFARAIFEIKKIDITINPVKTREYPSAANRPAYSVLDKSKIRNTFGLQIPNWRDSLEKCLSVL